MTKTIWLGHVALEVQHNSLGEIDSVTVIDPKVCVFDLLDSKVIEKIRESVDQDPDVARNIFRESQSLKGLTSGQ